MTNLKGVSGEGWTKPLGNPRLVFRVETMTEEEEEFAATLGAVHQAVLDNNPAKLERLIQEDYPLDERDAHSLTPLHLVSKTQTGDIFKSW